MGYSILIIGQTFNSCSVSLKILLKIIIHPIDIIRSLLYHLNNSLHY